MVTCSLLDVNVLIALGHEDHEDHSRAKAWFKQEKARPWATCPFTEAGFVRVVSNPSYQEPSLDVQDSLDMLAALRSLSGHRFWGVDFGFGEAVEPIASRFFGHQQVADAYLLAIAVRHKGRLVTFDRGLIFLAGEEFRGNIVVL
jgi:toxin-antitoxin system PIN domain toxin